MTLTTDRASFAARGTDSSPPLHRNPAPSRVLAPACLALALAGSLAAADAPRKTASFTFPTQTLTVPEGFVVEQVAGPPLVNRPISVAFDPQGRLYATDSSGLSERADKQIEQKPHRIVRLEDADGDGRFDRSVVFAENMMFPQGALFHEGSLYVAAPPHLWKLTDTDGDGVADQREVWYDGKTLTGCANDLHGPYLGPDGWFYFTKGAFAEQRHTLGDGRPFVTRAAHIFRARPDGSRFEPVLTGGMDNPVGVAFSSTGDRFLSGTFFQIGVAGKRDGLIHAIYGGVYGKENAASSGHVRTGDLMPIMTHMGAAAPCGSTAYRSDAFGPDYTDNLFVCYFNLRKISRHQLTPHGATFTTQDTDFVTSSSADFRPTDVLEDADGSLLVVDTGGWYKICCPTSQLAKPDILGGIYRIRKSVTRAPADPRGLAIKWSSATPAELVSLLADARPYVQDRALHTLAQRGEAAVSALQANGLAVPSVLGRRNAVWALARIDHPSAREAIRAALRDSDPSVRQAALHVVSLWRDPQPVDRLTEILADSRPAAARAAAEALGHANDDRAVDALLARAAALPLVATTASGTPEDPAARVFEHSLAYALVELHRGEPLLARLQPNRPPREVRVALLALDQMENSPLQPAHVLPWLKSSVPVLRQTAGWIVSHHADWGDALAGFFRDQANSIHQSDAAAQAGLQSQLAQLGASPAIQALLADLATEPRLPPGTRVLAFRAMASAGLKEAPASWLAAVATVVGQKEAEPITAAVTAARNFTLPKAGHVEFNVALIRVARDAQLKPETRLDALSAVPGSALSVLEPELFAFLREQLEGPGSPVNRGAAATVLAKAALSPTQQLELAGRLAQLSALELPKLLPAFERAPNEILGLQVLQGLDRSRGLAGVRPAVLRQLFAKYPASVRQQAEPLLARLNTDAARQNAQVDAVFADLKSGDVRRGQALFNSEKTACTLCHVVGYQGGRLGPDLTNIGRIRNERELLEAVMFPSATLVRGYEPFIVTTRSGETHSGILRKDAPDEVVLATGPDTEQRIPRADIAQLEPGPLSPMPPGLDAIMSRQELVDLVAFLKSRQ